MHVSVVVSGMCVMCSVNGMLCSVNGMFIGVQGGLSGGLDQSAWRCFSLFFFQDFFGGQWTHVYMCPIPFGVTFSKDLSKLKAQSSNVSFHRNVAKETFER